MKNNYKKLNSLSTAFLNDQLCHITYHDQSNRWTERVIKVEELHRDHVIAKCQVRGGEYRRFNFAQIHRVKRVRPPFGRLHRLSRVLAR